MTLAQQRRRARHEKRILAIARTTYRRCPRAWLRGADRQLARRKQERAARRRALACTLWASRCHGWSIGRIARALGVDANTLGDWRRRHHDPMDQLAARQLGAPAILANPQQRADVRFFLTMHGTYVGVAELHRHFPQIARRDLAALMHGARCDTDRAAASAPYLALTWHAPGRVWAMDHTEPPQPVEGRYRFVLTVRDLASGCALAAVAVEGADAASTVAVLADLIARHGAPLVLKADNGGAFTAVLTREFLRHHRIHLLLSPPYTPSYNGACEAGNGVIKHHAHRLACRHGRPERWTLDDIEAARLIANRRLTDRRQSRTPEERFAARVPITAQERDRFADSFRRVRGRRLRQLAIESKNRVRSIDADALERQAIADALSDTGVVTIWSARVRLPNKLQEAG